MSFETARIRVRTYGRLLIQLVALAGAALAGFNALLAPYVGTTYLTEYRSIIDAPVVVDRASTIAVIHLADVGLLVVALFVFFVTVRR